MEFESSNEEEFRLDYPDPIYARRAQGFILDMARLGAVSSGVEKFLFEWEAKEMEREYVGLVDFMNKKQARKRGKKTK